MRSLTPLLRALRPCRSARNVVPLRRDPAPTLWSYRWQRLMLTPLWRRALRLGLPAAAVLAAAGLWLGAPANREALWARAEALKTSVRERDAFMVAADFGSYAERQADVDALWRDPSRWWRSSIRNTAGVGWFSSDRTIAEYAAGTWRVPAPNL